MPHLQERIDSDGSSLISAGTVPRRVSENLPIMAATKKESMAIKGDSYDSDDTVQSPSVKHQVIPNSPAPHSPKPEQGPVLSIYGNTRLYSSPICVKKRTLTDVSKDGSDCESSSSTSLEDDKQRFSKYGRKESIPAAQSPFFENKFSEKLNKEKQNQDDSSVHLFKKAKIEGTPEHAKTKDQGASVQDRKAVISPASSNENKEDDESISQFSHGSAHPLYGRSSGSSPHHYQQYSSPHPSPYHPPPHHYGGPQYHQYPPGYNMFGIYSPIHGHHPTAHFGGGLPPPSMYYPPQYHHAPSYSRHHHGLTSPFRVPQREFPMRRDVSTPVAATPQTPKKSRSPSPSDSKEAPTECSRSAIGRPASAKRCVKLSEPIPSKFWGASDTTKDIKLPEFHRLVNYPDYLAKARGSSPYASNRADGKKHCVMCGELRYSSASTLKGRLVRKAGGEDVSAAASSDHIIPRQNKGLCTACDVSVWVLQDNGLEIKWCKGCKNFRPWAAFGSKGSATKCTRCRDRQKEKYALQKEGMKRKQDQRSKWEHLEEAANGLRSLIHAAAAN